MTAIKVENLSKKYIIGAAQERQDTLRDWLVAAGRSLRRRPTAENEFWALRDVSFEVQRGEVVGVIGRNGAGKSTLLKILSRITEPTSGRAYINGRVGSLLEVGTGFHPELTGRENIFLNGAILGMRRTEIARKFDEIVAFAEIEKFLDTPVKRYSSGMYVRLAFAVAAHLEPEILLVDEVLAVGDAAFQKKCLGKMGDVAKEGRTVLFVSHNMSAMQAICSRGLLIQAGQLVESGAIGDIVQEYVNRLQTQQYKSAAERLDRRGLGRSKILSVDVLSQKKGVFVGDEVQFAIRINRFLQNLSCILTIYNALGQRVAVFDSGLRSEIDCQSKGLFFTCTIPNLWLSPGRYYINVALSVGGEFEDHLEGAAFFAVEETSVWGRALRNYSTPVVFPHVWSIPGGE